MEFKKIPVILKRFNFEEKMRICTEYSRALLDVDGLISFNELNGKPLPWELETFALFSIISKNEYDNRYFKDRKSLKQFSNIINCIRNYLPPALVNNKQNIKFLDYFVLSTGLTQFQLQESFLFKYYRYSYFFNFQNDKIDMGVQFQNKFKSQYESFIIFGWLLNVVYSRNFQHDDQVLKIIEHLFNKYRHELSQLVIERENLIFLQFDVSSDYEDYLYCFKYFYQFPFIKEGEKFYLPLPHLVLQAVTSSLLFRLTEENKKLRDIFGKEVLENYLLKITKSSFNYDEIIPEFTYKGTLGTLRTLDLMIKDNNQCLAIDIKSMSPRIGVRNLDDSTIEDTQTRLAKNLANLYRHLNEKFLNEYFPFTTERKFEQENIFGLIIVLEDSYIRRENIYEEAANLINLNLDSKEYTWLCSNLKIISLYDYEKLMFHNENIFEHLSYIRDTSSQWFNYGLYSEEKANNNTINKELQTYREKLQNMIGEFADELVQVKIVSRN